MNINTHKNIASFFKIVIAIFVLTCFSIEAFSQDPRFSQFHASPFTLNPSFVGKDVVDWRLAMNLKTNAIGSIGLSDLNATTVSIEKNVLSNTNNTSQLGVGMMMLNEGGGDAVLRSNYLGLAIAYNVQIGEYSRIGLGLSAHHTNRYIDMSAIRFESQFGSEGFQNYIPSNEYSYLPNNNYWAMNEGIFYSYDKANWGYTIGAAYYNSNKPMEGFFSQSKYPIKTKISYQSKLWFRIGDGEVPKSIHLSHLSEYLGSNDVHSVGVIYKQGFSFSEQLRSVNFGLYKRFNEKYYPYLGVETNKWIAGISYDIPQANTTVTNTLKSVELSFILQLSGINAKDKRYNSDNIMAY